jgi:hypothetical protein
LHIDDSQQSIVSAQERTVRLVEDWRVLTRTRQDKHAGGWVRKYKGACNAPFGVPPYYFSANPDHLILAQAFQGREEAILRAAHEKTTAVYDKRKKRKLLARRAGELLGDGEQYDEELGQVYNDTVAGRLVDLLDDVQILTLTAWLEALKHERESRSAPISA